MNVFAMAGAQAVGQQMRQQQQDFPYKAKAQQSENHPHVVLRMPKNGTIVAKVPNGETLTVLGVDGNGPDSQGRVKWNDTEGWVKMTNVIPAKPADGDSLEAVGQQKRRQQQDFPYKAKAQQSDNFPHVMMKMPKNGTIVAKIPNGETLTVLGVDGDGPDSQGRVKWNDTEGWVKMTNVIPAKPADEDSLKARPELHAKNVRDLRTEALGMGLAETVVDEVLAMENPKAAITNFIAIKKACTHFICIGNPGAGKSTLLNSIIGKVVFESGFTFFKCCTTRCSYYEHNGVCFVDSPGIADLMIRTQAARELAAGLNLGASSKILFVVTLQGGYIRPEDTATMELVLESLLNAGICTTDLNFAVVINKSQEEEKMDPPTIECFVGEPAKREKDGIRISLKNKFIHIPHDDGVEDKSNELLGLTDDFKSRIKNLPSVDLTQKKGQIVVRHDMLQKRIEVYQKAVQEMLEAKEQMRKVKEQIRQEVIDERRNGPAQPFEVFEYDGSYNRSNQSHGKPLREQPRPREYAVCIGNKGVGTSTIASLIEQSLSPEYRKRDIELKMTELEGLADVSSRAEKAQRIRFGLNGKCHVYFITTLESGRPRLEDTETLKLVIEAAPMLSKRFDVIINKVTQAAKNEWEKPENCNDAKVLAQLQFPRKIWLVNKSPSPQLPNEFAQEARSVEIENHKVEAINSDTPQQLRATLKEQDEQLFKEKAEEMACRAITLEALLQLYEDLPKFMNFCPDRSTTADVTRQVIIPRSWSGKDEDGTAIAPILVKRHLDATVMVTHTWTNPFACTVAAMVAHALNKEYYVDTVLPDLKDAAKRQTLKQTLKARGKMNMKFWMCAICVNQHTSICAGSPQPQRASLYAEWDASRRDSVTGRLIEPCKCKTKKRLHGDRALCELNKFDTMMGFMHTRTPNLRLVLVVDQEFVVFERIWCMAEMVECGRQQIELDIQLPGREACKAKTTVLQNVRIENCKATTEEDKEQVLGRLRKDGDKAIVKFNQELQKVLNRVSKHIGQLAPANQAALQEFGHRSMATAISELQILMKGGKHAEVLVVCRQAEQALTAMIAEAKVKDSDSVEALQDFQRSVEAECNEMEHLNSEGERAKSQGNGLKVNECFKKFFEHQKTVLQVLEDSCATKAMNCRQATLSQDAKLLRNLFEFTAPDFVWDEVMHAMLGKELEVFESKSHRVTIFTGDTVNVLMLEVEAFNHKDAKCGCGQRCDGTQTWSFHAAAFTDIEQ